MPKDLPGFYYDAEKNRYFPIKGRLPGSSTHVPKPSPSKPEQIDDQHNKSRRKGIGTSKLLQARELSGKVLTLDKWRCNFRQEYQKIRASQPMIWKYEFTDMIADSSLEQLHVGLQTPEGQSETDFLLMGSMNGSLSLCEVGKDGQHFDDWVKCLPDRVWPLTPETQDESNNVPRHIWRPGGASTLLSSNISCIKKIQKHTPYTSDNGLSVQHALIATLGSETSGGSVYILNLGQPLDFNPSVPVLRRRIIEVASMNCTIWTVDCNYNGCQAVIGTNLGAALVNLETGALSWLCRSKSDVFSLQFDPSGNNILCGYRNGTIVTLDARQKPGVPPRLPRHRITQNLSRQWFEENPLHGTGIRIFIYIKRWYQTVQLTRFDLRISGEARVLGKEHEFLYMSKLIPNCPGFTTSIIDASYWDGVWPENPTHEHNFKWGIRQAKYHNQPLK